MGFLKNSIFLCVIIALVSCGWGGGSGGSPNSPPPGALLGGGTEYPGAMAPGLDSQGPGDQGGGLAEPRLQVSLSATMLENGEVEFRATWTDGTSPYTIAWDFGGGATNFSEQATVSPAIVSVAMNGLGPYYIQVTVTDALGVPGLGTWYYTLDPEDGEGVLVDDRIYAYYEKGQAAVGEEILVTVTTGKLSHPFQFMLGVGLVLDGDADYAANSFNVGSPGGEREFPDGIWANIAQNGFILAPDALYIPGANPDDSLGDRNRFDFNVSPLGGSDVDGASGDLFNFRVSYSEPGLKTLTFQKFNGVNRTYYSSLEAYESGSMESKVIFWDDCSNWHPWLQTSIVVE